MVFSPGDEVRQLVGVLAYTIEMLGGSLTLTDKELQDIYDNPKRLTILKDDMFRTIFKSDDYPDDPAPPVEPGPRGSNQPPPASPGTPPIGLTIHTAGVSAGGNQGVALYRRPDGTVSPVRASLSSIVPYNQ